MPRPERCDDVAPTGAGAESPLGAGARERATKRDAIPNSHGRDPGGRNATLPVEAA